VVIFNFAYRLLRIGLLRIGLLSIFLLWREVMRIGVLGGGLVFVFSTLLLAPTQVVAENQIPMAVVAKTHDILRMLRDFRPDPAKFEMNRRLISSAPPAELKGDALGDFFMTQAFAARSLGLARNAEVHFRSAVDAYGPVPRQLRIGALLELRFTLIRLGRAKEAAALTAEVIEKEFPRSSPIITDATYDMIRVGNLQGARELVEIAQQQLDQKKFESESKRQVETANLLGAKAVLANASCHRDLAEMYFAEQILAKDKAISLAQQEPQAQRATDQSNGLGQANGRCQASCRMNVYF
jgi:hypothetical protein